MRPSIASAQNLKFNASKNVFEGYNASRWLQVYTGDRAEANQGAEFTTTSTVFVDVPGMSVSINVQSGDWVTYTYSCNAKYAGGATGSDITLVQTSALTLSHAGGYWTDWGTDHGTMAASAGFGGVNHNNTTYVRIAVTGHLMVDTTGTLSLKLQNRRLGAGGTAYVDRCKVIVKID